MRGCNGCAVGERKVSFALSARDKRASRDRSGGSRCDCVAPSTFRDGKWGIAQLGPSTFSCHPGFSEASGSIPLEEGRPKKLELGRQSFGTLGTYGLRGKTIAGQVIADVRKKVISRDSISTMSQPSLANFIIKRPWLRRWMEPLSKWYFDNAGYRKLGLR